MKILKYVLLFIASILALITILISLGSAVCKFAEFPGNNLIEACGYVSYYWIVLISCLVALSLLLLSKVRIAVSYMVVMLIFTVLLNDFSLRFLSHPKAEDIRLFDNLNIGAYNVRYYSFGIENITKYINGSDYDVLLLSESVLTPEKLNYLRNNLNHYTIISDNGHDLSLLSKYPIVDFKIIELPTNIASLSGGNDIDSIKNNGIHRSFLHAVLNVNGTKVNLLSLRLIAGRPKDKSIGGSIKWGEYLVDAQDKELSAFLKYIRTLRGPIIFGGDLNVTPNTEIIHKISKYAVDSYLEDHACGGFTFNSSFPNSRLDYIFHSEDVFVKSSRIINAGLSDHFLLRVQFLIPKPTAQAMKQP